VLRTSRNDHDVAQTADRLFAAEANSILPLSIDTICSFAWTPGPDAPLYDYPLVAGENAAADLVADLLLSKAANVPKPTIVSSQIRIAF
jgi:hypothetical protein